MKALSIAALAGCAIIGCTQSTFAADILNSHPELDSGSINIDLTRKGQDELTPSYPSPSREGKMASKTANILGSQTDAGLADSSHVIARSGFVDGRSKASPDSEQNEVTGATLRNRNSVSVEQIQESAATWQFQAIGTATTDSLSKGEGLSGVNSTISLSPVRERARERGQVLTGFAADLNNIPAFDARTGEGLNATQNTASLRGSSEPWQSTSSTPTGFAADLSQLDFSQKPITTPTLDWMHSQGVEIKEAPQTTVYYEPYIIVDDDGNTIYSSYGFSSEYGSVPVEQYEQLQKDGIYYELVENRLYTETLDEFLGAVGYSSLEELFAAENCTTLEEFSQKFGYLTSTNPRPEYEKYISQFPIESIKDYGSAYSFVEATEDDAFASFSVADKNGNLTTKYYNFEYKTPEILSKNPNVEWSEAPSEIYIPLSTNDTRQYNYKYKNINNYERAESSIRVDADTQINGVLFEGLNRAITNDGGNFPSLNITADFVNNDTSFYAAIDNNGKLGNITGNFISNSSGGYGGAILNTGEGTVIGNITGDFIRNSASDGSAIYNGNRSEIGNITGNFIANVYTMPQPISLENSSRANNYSGTITNIGKIGNITGNFISNNTDWAIVNRYENKLPKRSARSFEDSGKIDNITGAFIGNNGGILNANERAVIGAINADFLSNRGTAIKNHGSIKSVTGDFINNYDGIDNSGKIGDITGNFVNNSGAAIDNHYGKLGTIRGNFIGNNYGVRNYQDLYYSNASSLNIEDSYFSRNQNPINRKIYGDRPLKQNANLNIKTSDFVENGNGYTGGAIFYGYNLGLDLPFGQDAVGKTLKNISANIENSNFVSNSSVNGGAIAILGSASNYGEIHLGSLSLASLEPAVNVDDSYFEQFGITEENAMVIKNSNFINNTADVSVMTESLTQDDSIISDDILRYTPHGGAVFSFGANVKIVADKGDSIFKGNRVINYGTEVLNDIYMVTPKGIINSMTDDGVYEYDKALTTLSLDTRNGGTISFGGTIDGCIGAYDYPAPTSLDEVTLDSRDGSSEGDEEPPMPKSAYKLNIIGDGTGKVVFGNSVLHANITTQNGSMSVLAKDANWDNNIVSFNGGTLSMRNDVVGIADFNRLLVANDTNLIADVDLKNQVMDRITAKEYGEHMGNLKVVGMNLLSDAKEDKTEIFFAEEGLKDHVTNGTGELPDKNQTVAYTPIYKYNVSYDNRNDGGYFVFNRGALINGGGGNSGNPSDNFNPAVLSAPTANVAATQATVNETFKYVFEHADAFTQMPSHVRHASLNANKYAISTDFNNNLGELYKNNSAGWFRPYVTFEKMDLKHGPKVDAITYGSLAGFDTDCHEHKRGWHSVGTGYIGYNGNQLHYHGVDTAMNGGLLGYTHTMYKNNFWTALTLSAGASVGESRTMYGKEDFTSLMAGVGSKTGYNFEFKEGKYILQPIMFLSYTFANTFDYTNAAGVKIKPSPAHSVLLNPSVRFIANTKNGWQPYASVGMVWNVLNENKVTANAVKLPEMGMKPYVEYGVGLQRNWKDRFTAFGQAMIRNGGRNGIALTGGFRWALGKEGKAIDKVQAPAQVSRHSGLDPESINAGLLINQNGQTLNLRARIKRDSTSFSPSARAVQGDTKVSVQNDKIFGSQNVKHNGLPRLAARNDVQSTKTVLKQLSPAQKTALGRRQNTTRTTSAAVLRAL